MRYASITQRLADLGGGKWELYSRAKQMAKDGQDIIHMTQEARSARHHTTTGL